MRKNGTRAMKGGCWSSENEGNKCTHAYAWMVALVSLPWALCDEIACLEKFPSFSSFYSFRTAPRSERASER